MKASGAVASVAIATATTSSGSPNVTLNSAQDFANGQFVVLIAAGPLCTLSAPTALAVRPENATGSTSYTYEVTAVGPNGCESAPSAPVTITNGNSSLGGAAWNKLGPWTAPSGTVQYYRVYGCSGASCSRKFIGFSYSTAFADMGEQGTLGGAMQSTISPPVAATRDNLFTRIVSGGGTTSLVLAASPSVSSSSIVFEHDNYTPIANTLAISNTASVFLPPGKYAIAATLTLTLSHRLSGTCGESFDRRMSSPSSQLVWQGQDAGLAVRAWDTNLARLDCLITDVSSAAGGTSTAMTAYYVDGSNVSSVGGASGTILENLWANGAKIGYQQGGNYCTLSASAPDCDTSAVRMLGLYNKSMLASSTGFVWKSTNAGDFSRYDNLETWNRGTYGFRVLHVGGGDFKLDRPQCNGAMQKGGSCIDLESPGSQITISGSITQASGISYHIRAPEGQSGNGNGLYILEDNYFSTPVSFESAGLVYSKGNLAASSSVTTSVSNGADVISIGDNLWNPWSASAGSAVFFAVGRNFHTGAVVGGIGDNLLSRLRISGPLISGLNTVSFSATPTFDASLGNTQKITLTGNVTSSTLSNAMAGETINFIICQDSRGSHTFVWPTNVLGGMTIGSTASKCSAQSFIFVGPNAYALSPGASNM